MSDTQNGFAERVNGILKTGFLLRCRGIGAAKKMVIESVSIYNRKRPHLSLIQNARCDAQGGGVK